VLFKIILYILGVVRELTKTKEREMGELETMETWQTRARGTNEDEYQIYLDCANDGKGGDITNDNKPLKTFEEWMGN